MGGHKFPKEPALFELWQEAINRQDPERPGTLWTPSTFSKVCSDHFTEEDYRERPTDVGQAKHHFLIETAVPSVGLGKGARKR